MQLLDPLEAREAEFAKFTDSEVARAALQEHVKEIISGPAFKGSHRSGQFLRYIIDQSIAGRFDLLKERLIGVELFGRSPSYDTGEDAIVRVTASDVRRRLLQHYGANSKSSEFRIGLPLGSYIPEITHLVPTPAADEAQASNSGEAGQAGASSGQTPASFGGAPAGEVAIGAQPARRQFTWKIWASAALVTTLIVVAWWWSMGSRHSAHASSASVASAVSLPWSSLLKASYPAHLITSDPNIVVIQELTGSELSLSDYANHKYIPERNNLTPEEIRYCRSILWGDNSAAAIDPPIAARIGALAALNSRELEARASRSIQLADLKTRDSFIFLGSPRSDPWTSLFNDQLDFRFYFDRGTKQEIVVNAHPRPNEQAKYVPTALGWATGKSYAIVAFLQNPDTDGQILILAGANGEGTEAAGKLVTDLPRLSGALRSCGVNPTGPPVHFEILLRLNTMAGSPSHVDIEACHILGNGASH